MIAKRVNPSIAFGEQGFGIPLAPLPLIDRLASRRGPHPGNGTGTLRIDGNGKRYLTLIDMRKAAAPGVDYESDWATVTFQVR